MDLYCYFHPHFNPKLRNVPPRMLEIGELEQAAQEFRCALERGRVRSENTPAGPIKSEHFQELVAALDYVIESLGIMLNAHPGDSPETLHQLVEERRNIPGWETWTQVVEQELRPTDNSFEEAA
jgi:hypothetical protein